MSRDVDVLLDELREALDVEPLAGFEGRLKAHVVATRPSAAPGVRGTILPALMAAGVAVGVALWWPGGVPSRSTVWSPAAAVAASHDPAGAPGVTGAIAIEASRAVRPGDSRAPEAGGRVDRAGRADVARRTGRTDVAGLAASTAAGPATGLLPGNVTGPVPGNVTGAAATPAFFVLVPPDQAHAIDRLLAARLAGRQVTLGPAPTFAGASDGEVPALEVPEIQIVPLPGGPPTAERKPR